MPQGTIKLLVDKGGYGFIAVPGGVDVFFLHKAVPGHGFRKLAVGQAVEFELLPTASTGRKGPRATRVTAVADATTA